MRTHTPTTPEQWSDLLRGQGLRVTEGRLSVLKFIEAHPHCSAAEVHRELTEQHPALSPQSVHNIVNDLSEHGLLRRIDLPDSGSALFETRTGDNHHHVQCVMCRRIEDVDCVIGEAPCMQPGDSHGMRLIEAAVTFRGVCAECDAQAGGRTPESASQQAA